VALFLSKNTQTALRVKCYRDLITSMIHHNTYSY